MPIAKPLPYVIRSSLSIVGRLKDYRRTAKQTATSMLIAAVVGLEELVDLIAKEIHTNAGITAMISLKPNSIC
jgi:hypothetical protein